MNALVEDMDAVFDKEQYTSSVLQTLIRGFQLGPRYYLFALPKYLCQRVGMGLSASDWDAFVNPFRELRRKVHQSLQIPEVYEEALKSLLAAGVRLTLPRSRIEGLVGSWWTVRDLPGDIIEFGAYRGATSLLLATLCRLSNINKQILVFDAFENRIPVLPYDGMRTGGEYRFETNAAETLMRQAETLQVSEFIKVHVGRFSDTIPRLNSWQGRLSFAHIDANYYQGTREACEFVIPRMVDGGVMVFDDYNGLCDLGARLAIDQCFVGTGIRPVPLASSSAMVRIKVPTGGHRKEDG